MKTNYTKQLLIVLICSIGLYASGNYLVKMSSINTLLDGLIVMIFFLCVFPFLIISTVLIRKIFKSISVIAHY